MFFPISMLLVFGSFWLGLGAMRNAVTRGRSSLCIYFSDFISLSIVIAIPLGFCVQTSAGANAPAALAVTSVAIFSWCIAAKMLASAGVAHPAKRSVFFVSFPALIVCSAMWAVFGYWGMSWFVGSATLTWWALGCVIVTVASIAAIRGSNEWVATFDPRSAEQQARLMPRLPGRDDKRGC